MNAVSGEGHSALIWVRAFDGTTTPGLRASIDGGAPIDLSTGITGELVEVFGRRAAAVPGGFVAVVAEVDGPEREPPVARMRWFDWSGAVVSSFDLPDADRWEVVSAGDRLLRGKDADEVVTVCLGDASSGEAACEEIYPVINHVVAYGDSARLSDGWLVAINDYGTGEFHFFCDQ